MAVQMKVSGTTTNYLIDSGCETEMIMSRAFADELGVKYERVGVKTRLPPADGTLLGDMSVGVESCQPWPPQYAREAFISSIPFLHQLTWQVNWRKNQMLIVRKGPSRTFARGKKYEIDASLEPSSMMKKTELKSLFYRRHLQKQIV